MATERLPMRKIREILRLRRQQGLSVREAARALGVSVGVVSKTSVRAERAGVTWAVAETLSDVELEERLYGRTPGRNDDRPRPDPVYLHTELRRAGVTLELLHLEYLEQHPTGLRYTAFCEVYRKWLAKGSLVMRQQHKAGEKCFIDFSGVRPHYVDPTTGEKVSVELFVAVLGASNLTFADVTARQTVEDFMAAHVRALEYFGGVPAMLVPDQLKAAVTLSCRYEPGIQQTYAELARHYGTAVVPARPYKARDKAKVEVGVQIAQRWILARLRNETFFSLETLRARVRELLEQLNARPMKKLGGISRRALFERVERQALKPLPERAYESAEWIERTVNVDYHVEVDKHWYSVPYELAHECVWARVTATTVELLHNNSRVASHRRSRVRYQHTTDPAHMPESHRQHAAGVDGVLAWARTVGPMTTALVERLIAANPVREQGYRSARGLQRIGEKYGPVRTELACERALRFGARSYKPVANILALGRENAPLPEDEVEERLAIQHENVRGPSTTTEERNRMLNEPTIEKLHHLRLANMAEAWEQQQRDATIGALSFDERFSLLVDAEYQARDNRRLTRLLKDAQLRIAEACTEDVATSAARGLDKATLRQLASCGWVNEHLNVLITGGTGVGKSFLACALAQSACRKGLRVLYRRVPRLLDELALARAEGSHARLLSKLAKFDVLVLDDWGLGTPKDSQRHDLLEVLEDRYGRVSTVVTSQLPREKWHEWLSDPTIADAILDRLVNNAYKIELKGHSRRRPETEPTN